MKTKTKTSTKTIVATVAIVAAAAGLGLASFRGPGLNIITNVAGAETYQLGDNDIELLSFDVHARRVDIMVADIGLEIIGDEDGDLSSIDADLPINEFLHNCALYDDYGFTVAGPLSPDSDGFVNFSDDFTISAEETLTLSLQCDSYDSDSSIGEITGETYVFVARLTDSTELQYQDVESGETIPVTQTRLGLRGHGVNVGGERFHVYLRNAGELSLTPSSETPYGDGYEPSFHELYRFNALAGPSSDITLAAFVFKFSATDNAESGWNECGSFDSSSVELYNLTKSGTSTPTAGTWQFLNDDGTDCTDSDELKYLRIEFASDTETVTAGDSHTFALYLDTSGASAEEGDMLGVNLPSQSSLLSETGYDTVIWQDVSDSWFTGEDLSSRLPVPGGLIGYYE